MKKASFKLAQINILEDVKNIKNIDIDVDLGKRFKYDSKKNVQICVSSQNDKIYKDKYDKINELNNLETLDSNC